MNIELSRSACGEMCLVGTDPDTHLKVIRYIRFSGSSKSTSDLKANYKEAMSYIRLVEKVGIDNHLDLYDFYDWWFSNSRLVVGGYRALVGVFGKNTLSFAEFVSIKFCEYLKPSESGFLNGTDPDALDGFVLGVDHSCKFFMMSGSEFAVGGMTGRVVYTGGTYPVMSLVLGWADLNKEVDRYVTRT